MFGPLHKRLALGKTLFYELGICESTRSVLCLSCRTFSLKSLENKQLRDFKISYLMNSCGLPLETAESVSRKMESLRPEKADSVLRILRNQGFGDTQISQIVRKTPNVLNLNPEKIILPKLDFFNSTGIASDVLARIISLNPVLLNRSLMKSLVPNFELLKTIFVDDESVLSALKCNSRILLVDVHKNVAPNITALKEAGVPERFLRYIVTRFAAVVIQSRGKFDKCFDEVTKMGLHPREVKFLAAMHVFSSVGEHSRNCKMDVLRKCGWSEDEIQTAFKKYPQFMMISDKKIVSKMDFLVKEMNWSPSSIAQFPRVLACNLESRLIPRCSVIKFLQTKGFVRKDLKLSAFLQLTDKRFSEEFVDCYLKSVPQLLGVYRTKSGTLDLHDKKQLGF